MLLIFTLAIFFYAGLYITAQIYLSWLPKYDEDEGLKHKYVAIFLIYDIFLIMMIIGLYTQKYSLEVIAGIQLVFIVYLIVARAYFVKSQNVLLIICQVIGLLFTSFLAARNHISLSDKITSYIVIGFEGLLILVSLLGIVRLYLHAKGNEKAWKLFHEEEDRLKGKDTFSKN